MRLHQTEVVLHFRPVSNLIKMDQGFIQAANLIGSSGLTETKESADRGVVLLRKIKPYQKDKAADRPDISG